jgi:N-acetylmuramoyl-L-alanine amidase
MPKSLYITSGHTISGNRGTGAHGVKGKNGKQFDEAVEARKLVNDIMAHQKKWYGLDSFTDKDTQSLGTVISNMEASVNECFVCVDVHFNAAGSAKARGTEVYIPERYTVAELNLASDMANAISSALGTKLRSGKLIKKGVKTESESQHPRIGILSRPHKALNMLLEICFITSPEDVQAYRKNYFTLVQKISDCLGNHRLKE